MNIWIRNNKIFEFYETLLIIDNWLINNSKWTNAKLWKINSKVFYLPVYSLDFALIEMWFSILKEHLKLNEKINI